MVQNKTTRPPQKTRPKATGKNQTLRIIGGQWRSRTLNFPEIEGLRPTGNRIRETLFNWLMPYLANTQCLDLFAGSGALGLEALSRGAAHCTFCESNPLAAKQLQTNLQTLKADNAKVHMGDALHMLSQPGEAYSLVFVDPPFTAELWQSTLTRLEEGNWLSNGAMIYVESPKNYSVAIPSSWKLHRSKSIGDVCYSLFKRDNNEDSL